MVIQHNMLSMNASRNLGISLKNLSKATEKLSSGYKINRAGDDAARLAISEKMRGQIRGLNQAVGNSEDSISLIQTAEGAMQQSHEILQRMRSLAVQSANDTNTSDDRTHIQEEIKELAKELDRVANTTEYNTKTLTDGSYSSQNGKDDIKTSIQEYLKGSWISDSLTRIKDGTGLDVEGPINLKVEFKDGLGTTVAQMAATAGGKDFTLTINNDYIKDKTINDFVGNSGLEAGGILYDRLITHEMTHSVMMHNCSSSVLASLNGGYLWFVEGLAEAVQGNDRLSVQSLQGIKDNMNSTAADAVYKQGYLAVSWMSNNVQNGTFDGFMKALKTDGSTFDALVKQYYGENTGSDLFNKIKNSAINDTASFVNAAQITLGDGKQDALGDWDADAEDIVLNGGSAETIKSSEESVSIKGDTWNITWEGIKTSKEGLHLQVGANSGQEVMLSIGDIRTQSLFGLEELDVESQEKASGCITRVDNAIQKISGFRAELGAMQNRLESTISNLSISSENLTSAESGIRDTDMAKEMTNYTKDNILSQAGQAILSQANNSMQGVLSLLR